MKLRRREFIGSALAAGVASLTDPRTVAADPDRPRGPRRIEVERLYRVPGMPNALEADSDGLWVADQISERMYKVDYETGAVLREVQTESHNTSGLGVGGGYLWLGANGATQRREPRPGDRPYGELLQADLNTGRTLRAHRPVWGGGIHGVTYVQETDTLWVTALSVSALAELDVRDDFRILRMVRIQGNAPHGITWYDGSIWCVFAGDLRAQRIDPDSARVLETYQLSPEDPDQHGMTIHNGYMYYCDAGEGGSRTPSPGSAPGYVCRFKLS